VKSFDYDAVIYDGEIYCIGCLPKEVDYTSDDVFPIFADSEWDTFPVCCVCNTEHEYVSLLDYTG